MELPTKCLNCGEITEYVLNKKASTLTSDCECGAKCIMQIVKKEDGKDRHEF